mmetsp:Transcript_100600/g.313595  ORF Transcript_100600/g.313595 Transcript_100600/m.313595 type:complete len:312 (+) Transcript_100600:824-1759(+)
MPTRRCRSPRQDEVDRGEPPVIEEVEDPRVTKFPAAGQDVLLAAAHHQEVAAPVQLDERGRVAVPPLRVRALEANGAVPAPVVDAERLRVAELEVAVLRVASEDDHGALRQLAPRAPGPKEPRRDVGRGVGANPPGFRAARGRGGIALPAARTGGCLRSAPDNGGWLGALLLEEHADGPLAVLGLVGALAAAVGEHQRPAGPWRGSLERGLGRPRRELRGRGLHVRPRGRVGAAPERRQRLAARRVHGRSSGFSPSEAPRTATRRTGGVGSAPGLLLGGPGRSAHLLECHIMQVVLGAHAAPAAVAKQLLA